MLKELLKDNIIIQDKVDTWQTAINLSAKPLLQKKYITDSYIDTIIKNVEKLGLYIVISPEIVLSHARPEDGVNTMCLSLLKTHTPIDFGKDNNKIQLIFTLGAVDNNSHLGLLEELATLLQDHFDTIMKAKTIKEIEDVL